MTDRLGRTIDYLRVSVTDRCNLRCRYCMPEETPWVPRRKVLRYEELERVCAAAARLGVKTVRVTGGEPLVRKDCPRFIGRLKSTPGIRTVTLTTNAVLLAEQLPELLEAGLDGVNISLDTLDRAEYAALTGRDQLSHVLEGIEAALAAGLSTKLNAVPLASAGPEDLTALSALAERWPVDVRFIELMPIGHGAGLAGYDQAALFTLLKERWPRLAPSPERRGSGPAQYWTAPELKGSLGFISAVSHAFCETCNRVRLTSEGFLKLCLCYGDGVDLRQPLRSGISDEALTELIRRSVWEKPARHSFRQGPAQEERNMSQIGG